MDEVVGVEVVLANLTRLQERFMVQRHIAGKKIGIFLENYAKGNHRWKPRTGMTDLSTKGDIDQETAEFLTVALTAGMSYDVFLELAMQKRWSWLWPSLENNRETIMQIFAEAMEVRL